MVCLVAHWDGQHNYQITEPLNELVKDTHYWRFLDTVTWPEYLAKLAPSHHCSLSLSHHRMRPVHSMSLLAKLEIQMFNVGLYSVNRSTIMKLRVGAHARRQEVDGYRR